MNFVLASCLPRGGATASPDGVVVAAWRCGRSMAVLEDAMHCIEVAYRSSSFSQKESISCKVQGALVTLAREG